MAIIRIIRGILIMDGQLMSDTFEVTGGDNTSCHYIILTISKKDSAV